MNGNNYNDPNRRTPNYTGNGRNTEVNPEYNFNSSGGYGDSGQYETVTPDAVWDHIPQNRNNSSPSMNVLSGIGIALSLISIIVTALALIFSWFFYVGFIMNIISAVLAITGTVVGVINLNISKRAGLPSGEFPVIAIVLGILAILLSGVIFSCTGCAACFYCTR